MTPPPRPPDRRPLSPSELAPLMHRALCQVLHEMLEVLENANIEALSAWIVAGVPLFASDTLPTMRMLTAEARRVLLTLAVERYEGNITYIAQALGTSRRSVREQLKQAGMYDVQGPVWGGSHRQGAEPERGDPRPLERRLESGDPMEMPPEEEEDTHPIRIEGEDDA